MSKNIHATQDWVRDNISIKPKVSGEIISLSDSAEQPLQSMKIFGKTTQDGTPTPENPIELVSVGDGGSTTEYVIGKNLFNNDTSLLKEVTYNSFDGTNRRIGYEPLQLPSGTYTFTLTELDASVPKYVYGSINDKDGNYVRDCRLLQSTNNFTPLTITVNDGDKIYIYDGYRNINDAKNLTFSKVQIQLNAGSVAKPYETYKGQSLTIPTPNGLPGIPVSSGGNYTDSNGQQYVSDYKDYERMVYVQRVKLDYLPLPHTVGQHDNGVKYASFFSNGGSKKSNTPIISNQYIGGVWSNITNHIYIASGGTIVVTDNRFTDLATAKEIISTEKPMALYPLAEPIETPLTEEEIQAYKALHTNYPNTTIYNSDGAGAEVEYVADTKNYIDNKIADEVAKLTAAIITE